MRFFGLHARFLGRKTAQGVLPSGPVECARPPERQKGMKGKLLWGLVCLASGGCLGGEFEALGGGAALDAAQEVEVADGGIDATEREAAPDAPSERAAEAQAYVDAADAASAEEADAAEAGCPTIHIELAVYGNNCIEPDGCPFGTSCAADDVTEVVRRGAAPSTPCEGASECVYHAGAGCASCWTMGCPRTALVRYRCGAAMHEVNVAAEAWAVPIELSCKC